MDKKKIFGVLVFSILMIGSASAQELNTDALQFEGLEPSFDQSGITFEGYDENRTFTPKQIFVPDEISDKATLSGYNYDNVAQGERVEFTGYTYQQYVDYGSEPLNDLLGRGGSDATQGSEYPVNYFQIGAYSSDLTGQNQSISDVFDYEFKQSNSGYDVFWNIDVSNHYEHLIVDYELYYNDTTDNSSPELVGSFQDVYSGNDTEKVTFGADASSTGVNKFTKNITYDNLYEPVDHEIVYFTIPEKANLTSFDFGGLNHSEIDYNYSDVKQELQDADVNNSLILNDVEGLETRAFNVTFPENSKRNVSADYEFDYKKESENSLTFTRNPDFNTYIIGSGGAITYSSSTTLCNDVTNSGTPYKDVVVESGATIDVCSSSGKVNISTVDRGSIVVNGTINGNSAGRTQEETSEMNGDGDSTYDGGGGGAGGSYISAGGDGGCGASPYGCGNGRSYGGNAEPDNGNGRFTIGWAGGRGGGYDGLGSGGDGGHGGGAVMLKASEVFVNGNIYANGGNGKVNDCGAGGGGSGGSIVLEAYNLDLSNGNLDARGGNGNDGPACGYDGGGGGGGSGGYIEGLYENLYTSGSYDTGKGFGGSGSEDGQDGGSGTSYFSQTSVSYSQPNAIPSISEAKYSESEKTGENDLNISIDDGDESDITSYTGVSNVGLFTNKTLLVDALTLPYSANLDIMDSKSAVGSYNLNFSKSVSAVLERSSYEHSTSVQRIKKEVNFSNDASDSFNFEYTFSDPSGSSVVNDTAIGSVSGNSFAVGEGVWSGDWISSEGTSVGYSANTSRSHNLSKQWLLDGTTFSAVNSQSFTFKDVNISDYCPSTGLKDISPGSNAISCDTTEVSGDYLKNEKDFGIFHNSGTVKYGDLDANVTGEQRIRVNNTEKTTIDVNMSNMVQSFSQCSQNGNDIAKVSGKGLQNSTIEFNCNPGDTVGSSTITKSELSDAYKYSYEVSANVHSEVASEVAQYLYIEESRLSKWGSRDPTRTESIVDGQSSKSDKLAVENVVEDGTNYVRIKVPNDYGSSSLHTGTHDFTLNYYESKNSGGSTSSGGGGGGSTTIVKNVTNAEYSWTLSTFGGDGDTIQLLGYPGRTLENTLQVENTGDNKVTLNVNCQSSQGNCEWVQPEVDRVEVEPGQTTTFGVTATVPRDVNASELQYNIVVSDPSNSGSDSSASVTFLVEMSRAGGFILDYFGRFGEPLATLEAPNEEGSDIPVPYWLVSFLSAVSSLVVTRSITNKLIVGQVSLAVLIFLLVPVLI